MNAIRTFAALSLAALATACASPGATDAVPAAGMSPGMAHGGTSMPMATMDPRMKAMMDMHQKMMTAKSPAERQALMADHMKAMQEGMAMMKEMHVGTEGMVGGGMGGMAGMDHSKGMPAGMAQRHQMMTEHHGHDADDDGHDDAAHASVAGRPVRAGASSEGPSPRHCRDFL